jgi:hypothetical protein
VSVAISVTALEPVSRIENATELDRDPDARRVARTLSPPSPNWGSIPASGSGISVTTSPFAPSRITTVEASDHRRNTKRSFESIANQSTFRIVAGDRWFALSSISPRIRSCSSPGPRSASWTAEDAAIPIGKLRAPVAQTTVPMCMEFAAKENLLPPRTQGTRILR